MRNSGAVAVVEGVGDHGCEYMTGGTVVVLGRTGVNFAAGMSGGVAYVLDEDQLFDTKCNLEMVDVEPVTSMKDRTTLRQLVERHVMYTRSEHATRILRDWSEMLPWFVKVMPIDYKKALERMAEEESKETEIVHADRGGVPLMGHPSGFLQFDRKTGHYLSPRGAGEDVEGVHRNPAG